MLHTQGERLEDGKIWILNMQQGQDREVSHKGQCPKSLPASMEVPEASSNPLKLPRFPRDTSIEFMDAGRKGFTINVVGSDHVSHRDERPSFLRSFYHQFIKRLGRQSMGQKH